MFKKTKINDSEVMRYGFLGGMAEATYCLFVVMLITVLDRAFPAPGLIAGPLMFLLLFVVSAGISGVLTLGYPAYLAMQKRYAEALMTAVTTFASLVLIGVLMIMLISFV